MGKLYEQLIATRLQEAVDVNGFLKGTSTIEAMLAVKKYVKAEKDKTYKSREIYIVTTLDVKNALNWASWKDVMVEQMKRNIPKYLIRVIISYHEDRKVLVGEGWQLTVLYDL